MVVSISILIMLYMVMLGPFKLIGPFYINTLHADNDLRRKIALKAVVLSTVVSITIVAIGSYLTTRLNLSLDVLTIMMGFFMAHWSVQNALAKPGQPIKPPENPTIDLAIFPVALPEIIPPQAIALLVLSSSIHVDEMENQMSSVMTIGLIILGVMVLNWLAMITAPALMKFPVFWGIVARIVAVLLAAVSLQIILSGLNSMGLISVIFNN